MKIDAYRHEVTGFEFEATDEQSRIWECRASFIYENQGTLDDPKFVTTDLNEFEGRCVAGEYHAVCPSPKLLTALKDEIETNDSIHEAETMAIACGRTMFSFGFCKRPISVSLVLPRMPLRGASAAELPNCENVNCENFMNDQTPKPTRIISNAKITSTILGGKASDGRCFSSFINLDYGGSGQGFGGFCFDSWNQDKQRRIGVAWGMEFIARTLEVVGVEAWEDLVGKHVRVDHEEFGQIYRIGHIVENKWFDPKADLDFLMPAAKKID